ncbi:ribonuclease H2, subunit B [Lipomyces kononenkoae]|uniref:Ribonuclease H2, subunit B n=1 Tax=Lipomyces kononenkoae TaxID=34357 RepID=A0ACC3T1E3_LIPKO
MSRLFILPAEKGEGGNSACKIISLPHPSTGVPTRYLVTRSPLAVHELTIIDHPAPHSTLISHDDDQSLSDCLDDDGGGPVAATAATAAAAHESLQTGRDMAGGSIISSSQVCVATPMAAFFFLVRVLVQHESQYRPWEDIFDWLQLETPAYRHIAALLEPELAKITDSVEVTESMQCYRLSRDKLFRLLSGRITRIANNLPAIVRQTHVTNKLAPVRFDETTPDEMYELAKRQVAITILSGYLPSSVAAEFMCGFASEKKVLDDFMSQLKEARAQEMMKQMMVAGVVGNRGKNKFEDEDEALKNKKAAKNGMASNGVKKLKKVDTSGTRKLTSFFGKK